MHVLRARAASAHASHNPGFVQAPTSLWLTQTVRGFWREFSGNWVGVPRESRPLTEVSGIVVDTDECEYYGRSFAMLYGDMDRLLPMRLLEVPPMRRNELTEYRLTKHDERARAVSEIQSRVNRGSRVPLAPEDLRKDFVNRWGPRRVLILRRPFKRSPDKREGDA